MPDATTLINQGLDHGDPFAGAVLGEALPTAEEATALRTTNKELFAATQTLLDGLEKNAQEQHETRLADARATLSGLREPVNGIGILGPDVEAIEAVTKAAEQRIASEMSEYRMTAYALHKDDIDARLARLGKAEAKLATFVATFPTPLHYLESQNLEDTRRATMHTNVAHAGPHALTTLAQVAIRTGNRALGAAIAARVNQLPVGERPFTAAAFAERLVGQEHGHYVETYRELRNFHQAASNQLRRFQRGSAIADKPIDKIRRGLTTVVPESSASLGKAIRAEASRQQA